MPDQFESQEELVEVEDVNNEDFDFAEEEDFEDEDEDEDSE